VTDRFLRIKDVMARTGLTRTAIYRRIADGTFPKQVPLGPATVAWRESELEAWMKDPTGWREMA
jgi:prophage regulatory protein